jgi:hypothetical protein
LALESTSCEDCGGALSETADDDAMEIDGQAESGCAECGKQVCEHCSINILGEQRRCLACAGKKTGVAGLEWTGGGVGASESSWRASWGCSGFVSDVY